MLKFFERIAVQEEKPPLLYDKACVSHYCVLEIL